MSQGNLYVPCDICDLTPSIFILLNLTHLCERCHIALFHKRITQAERIRSILINKFEFSSNTQEWYVFDNMRSFQILFPEFKGKLQKFPQSNDDGCECNSKRFMMCVYNLRHPDYKFVIDDCSPIGSYTNRFNTSFTSTPTGVAVNMCHECVRKSIPGERYGNSCNRCGEFFTGYHDLCEDCRNVVYSTCGNPHHNDVMRSKRLHRRYH
jgi:hypothetical protein